MALKTLVRATAIVLAACVIIYLAFSMTTTPVDDLPSAGTPGADVAEPTAPAG